MKSDIAQHYASAKRLSKTKGRLSNLVKLDLMWKREGRNGDESDTVNREKMGEARTSAKPAWLSATLNLHVPSSIVVLKVKAKASQTKQVSMIIEVISLVL